MFTGLVETQGEVIWLRAKDKKVQLTISCPAFRGALTIGESISINGCCLTLAHSREGSLTFDLLQETLDRTNLGSLRKNDPVNLERALSAGSRLGGHFVQGHVDCTVPVISRIKKGADTRLEVSLLEEFAHYVAYKGSIAINGVSLTVAEVLPKSCVMWIIPHTAKVTNLGQLESNDRVNVEFDMLAKYVERILACNRGPT
ncbi:MAG: riboflavin synthase [Verrucomicrobiales bacterium]